MRQAAVALHWDAALALEWLSVALGQKATAAGVDGTGNSLRGSPLWTLSFRWA